MSSTTSAVSSSTSADHEMDSSKTGLDVRTRTVSVATVLVAMMYLLSSSQGTMSDLGLWVPSKSLQGTMSDFFQADLHEYPALEWAAVARVSVVCVLVFFGYAAHLSLIVPRPCGTKTWADVGIQLLIFIGDMLLLPYYAFFPEVRCSVFYDKTSERNQRLFAAAPSLTQFRMTFWLRNNWLNLIYPTMKELWCWTYAREAYLADIRREIVPLAEGGQVALDWYTAGDSLPDTAPVLFLGATLMGDGHSEPTRDLASRFCAQGWRCCCFVKRGCGYFDVLPLTEDDWMPTDPSSFKDVKLGLEMVRKRYPQAFLAFAGLSAGGSFVRNYCAMAGENNVVDAAMSLDGGFKFWETIQHVDAHNTFIGKVLGTAQARPLLMKAETKSPPAWLDIEALSAAQKQSWSAVLDVAHRNSTSSASLDDWFAANSDQYQDLPQRSAVPLLVLVSHGDGCPPESYWNSIDNVKELPSQCKNTFVCINAFGAHIYRVSGARAEGNWVADATLEFFNAVKSERLASREGATETN